MGESKRPNNRDTSHHACVQEGGMPFRPSLRAWDDMSETEISEKLSRSSEDIAVGRISAQCDMDTKVKELLQSRAAKI